MSSLSAEGVASISKVVVELGQECGVSLVRDGGAGGDEGALESFFSPKVSLQNVQRRESLPSPGSREVKAVSNKEDEEAKVGTDGNFEKYCHTHPRTLNHTERQIATQASREQAEWRRPTRSQSVSC